MKATVKLESKERGVITTSITVQIESDDPQMVSMIMSAMIDQLLSDNYIPLNPAKEEDMK